jgi:hypothetical protein
MTNPIEYANELCCDDCSDLRRPLHSWSDEVEPPEARCVAESCKVDVEALRKLEIYADLAASFLGGVLRLDAPAFEWWSLWWAETLIDRYDGACVAHASLRALLVSGAKERAGVAA